jgi:hypothetical protein
MSSICESEAEHDFNWESHALFSTKDLSLGKYVFISVYSRRQLAGLFVVSRVTNSIVGQVMN